jgi:small subunit ribosomal protein S20
MANLKSSAKRARQNYKRRDANRYYRTTARTYVKEARAQIEANKLDDAQETIRQAVKALDKAAQKGIIHRNNAARRKARLMKAFNQAQTTAS